MPLVEVANVDNEPVEMHYEVHGSGPQRILFIAGLGSVGRVWDKQVEHFTSFPEFSVCTFDNVNIGRSSVRTGAYSIAMMAADTLALLDHLDWKHVHVVGTSMGGMISQELCVLLGDRVISLSLASTYSKFNGIPLPMLRMSIFGTGFAADDIKGYAQYFPTIMFPPKWLGLTSKDDPSITNHEAMTAFVYERNSNAGRLDPDAISRSQRAAFFHYCDRRLDDIRAHGYPILVVAGDEDYILRQPSGSEYLAKRLQARFEIYKGGGHSIYWQDPEWYNNLVLDNIRKGHARHLAKTES
ncbi:Alpha/Beta hydrolase protein [Entophlyctis helioformis]|nr:Alpha/Beta hydrolase protein [Entophlyctis helioformis]